MEERVTPEIEREYTEGGSPPAEKAAEPVTEVETELRRKVEDLGITAQARAKELGGMAGERTREVADKIRYFSEQARAEAGVRLEEAGDYLGQKMDDVSANSREAVRRSPGVALAMTAGIGFLLGFLSRRIFANRGRM